MLTTTRRDFIGTLAALPLVGLDRADPDLILYHGELHTVATGRPAATAVAISSGRFVAVGDDRDVLALAGPRTRGSMASTSCGTWPATNRRSRKFWRRCVSGRRAPRPAPGCAATSTTTARRRAP